MEKVISETGTEQRHPRQQRKYKDVLGGKERRETLRE